MQEIMWYILGLEWLPEGIIEHLKNFSPCTMVLRQNTIDLVAYKQETFIFHSYGGC